jgi:hypothetical protein
MGWVDVACLPVPEPMPDYASDQFKYLHVKDTPRDIDGSKREVNDFNPRIQLKKLFQQGCCIIKKQQEKPERERKEIEEMQNKNKAMMISTGWRLLTAKL